MKQIKTPKPPREITNVEGRVHRHGPNFVNITGRVYHHLSVIGFVGTRGEGKDAMWRCRCVCGKEHDVIGYALRKGTTKSCGCRKEEMRAPHITTHGHSRGGKVSQEYAVWRNMYNRCYRPKDISYHNYGGRGIRVCDPWLGNFGNFFADMGPKPTPKHSIDRIDTEGNYCPANCRWSSGIEQHSNKRSNVFYELNGERLTQAEWARRLGADHTTLQSRFDRGWSLERALLTPVRPVRKVAPCQS
jgi:hypothetical protein